MAVELLETQIDAPEPLRSVMGTAERDLLCAIAYVYLACGRPRPALALLRLVERNMPDDVEMLRILTYAYLADGSGAPAIALLDRLEQLDSDRASRGPLMLLRSHALRHDGQWEKARACFAEFVAIRSAGADV